MLSSSIGEQTVSINGKEYLIDSTTTQIATNYPKFDTLAFVFAYQDEEKQIICNFKPDSSYIITLACCAELDIIAESKFHNDSLAYWDLEEDFHKIQNQLMSKPFISIRTKEKPLSLIYAWNNSGTVEPKYNTINTDLWRFGIPPKGFYWNNITTITFFTQDVELTNHYKDIEEFLGIDNILILNHISFRLFDDEKFELIFDEKNNEIELKYEQNVI